jgi:hypothetical protein
VGAGPPRADPPDVPQALEPPERPIDVGAQRLAQFLAGQARALAHQLSDFMRDGWHRCIVCGSAMAKGPGNG